MHELSITQSMLDLVVEQARQAGARKVNTINLVIGGMTGVVGDSVRFYMDFLSKETIAEGSVLNIKNIKAQARCRECCEEFDIDEFQWQCPVCGNTGIEIIRGTELSVESIEVD